MQFVQVGDDPKAAEALEDLDDALSKRHKIRVGTLQNSKFISI
jgi:hypothetical protein